MANKRKPTIQQSIAPNATLIRGEATMRAAGNNNPVNVMQMVTNSISKYMAPAMRQAEQQKNLSDEKWNNWLKSLGPNVDTEGLNPQQTAIVGQAASNLKSQYLDTYKELSSISNKQSPEYMDAVGRMNDIMAEFKGLSTFKNGHLENKDLFTENKKQGNYSNQSQGDGSYNTAVEIYGAGVDGNGSEWVLGDDGKTIMYSTSNGPMKPADIPDTTLIDYKAAGDISTMLTTIDEAGTGLTAPKENALRSKLETMLGSNPAALNSLIKDNKLPNVVFDIPEEIMTGDPGLLRETVINQIVASSSQSAAAEKARQKQNTGRTYNFRVEKEFYASHKGPDGKIYDKQRGTDGSTRFIDDKGRVYAGDVDELEENVIAVDTDNTKPNGQGPQKNPNVTFSEGEERADLEAYAKTKGIENPTDEQLEELYQSISTGKN